MIFLQSYILNLLKVNDCVVIPGIGAFIAREVPAFYNNKNHTFRAPGKDLSFNVLLHEDDGLLINHIAKSRHLSYGEAKSLVSEQVSLTLKQLETDEVSVKEIGVLARNEEGQIEFKPSQLRYDNLNLYGLQHSIQIKALETDANTSAPPVILKNEVVMEKNTIIKIVSASIAAAIIIGLFVVFPIKGSKNVQEANVGIASDSNNQNKESSVFDAGNPASTQPVVSQVHEEPVAASPIKVEVEESLSIDDFNANNGTVGSSSHTASSTKEATKPIEKTAVEYLDQSEVYYHLVIGSVRSNSAAMKLVDNIRGKGISASVLDCGERYRIVNKSFTNKREAIQYLHEFRSENPSHADAWIYVEKVQ